MKLLVLLLVLPCVLAGCGKRPAGSRVMNGDNAAPHAWPWQISLRSGTKRYHTCGGTLVRPDWVVTAAHCVYKNTDPGAYSVVVGAHRRRGTTSVQQSLSIKKLIVHPDFTLNRAVKNDIALLQLSKPVTLSDKVNLACLPTKHVTLGSKCYITGWGRMENGASADFLQQALLPPVSQTTCRKKWKVEFKPHLCAGEARDGATGGCNGDSGGPFVCKEGGRWVLHGAVSYGMKWCDTNYYTVFARVFTYMDWINGHLGLGPLPSGQPTPPVPETPPMPETPRPPQPTTPSPGGCSDQWGTRCRFYQSSCHLPFVKKACSKTCKDC